jgi:FtsZ-binding cell division protein ZapB
LEQVHALSQLSKGDWYSMSDYAFEYESIMDRVSFLEIEVERLRNENTELTNELYAVQNRIDTILFSKIDLILKENENGTIGFS